jgi:hypothetical protein
MSDDIRTIIDTEMRNEYARLVAILASFEDQGMSESDQLAYFKGLLAAQYAYLAGMITEENHSDLMYQIYDLAGFHADHKHAYLFAN